MKILYHRKDTVFFRFTSANKVAFITGLPYSDSIYCASKRIRFIALYWPNFIELITYPVLEKEF